MSYVCPRCNATIIREIVDHVTRFGYACTYRRPAEQPTQSSSDDPLSPVYTFGSNIDSDTSSPPADTGSTDYSGGGGDFGGGGSSGDF